MALHRQVDQTVVTCVSRSERTGFEEPLHLLLFSGPQQKQQVGITVPKTILNVSCRQRWSHNESTNTLLQRIFLFFFFFFILSRNQMSKSVLKLFAPDCLCLWLWPPHRDPLLPGALAAQILEVCEAGCERTESC